MSDSDQKADDGTACPKCNAPDQYPRLIADPLTRKRFLFFECTKCRQPHWVPIEQEEK